MVSNVGMYTSDEMSKKEIYELKRKLHITEEKYEDQVSVNKNLQSELSLLRSKEKRTISDTMKIHAKESKRNENELQKVTNELTTERMLRSELESKLSLHQAEMIVLLDRVKVCKREKEEWMVRQEHYEEKEQRLEVSEDYSLYDDVVIDR
jgi:hypothetical protein